VSLIPFNTFGGEVPRLSAWELPSGAASQAVNVDLAHGDLKGLRGNAPFATATLAGAIRAVFTDDGINFFAWPYEVYPVKSMVVGDIYYRLYYTAMQADGPIIKVARTRRADGSANPPAVIGTAIVGGNFQPPERSNIGDLNTGPDSWVLGVPAPAVQGGTDPVAKFLDNLGATLVDKSAWPKIPRLQLRVTYFIEAPDGTIVSQSDITNTEAGISPGNGAIYPQVLYTNDSSLRGNKFQDMLWPMGYTPRPYKYYWFAPPPLAAAAIARSVAVNNTGSGPIVITYGGAVVPDPGSGNPGGSDGNEA